MNTKTHALNIRKNIIKSGFLGKQAHFGGSLSIADILAVVFEKYLTASNTDNKNNKFILSKGHCALALYATLYEYGFISKEQLESFNSDGGEFPSHSVKNEKYGIEVSSGSLGLGLSFGLGKCLALSEKSTVYVLVGNGEANEGSFWESVMFAGSKKIKNICLIIDDNQMQLDGKSDDILPFNHLEQKLIAFGFNVVSCDGHDLDSLANAFTSQTGPYAVVCHTVKGKGVSFMENNPSWHHNSLTQEQYEQAMTELGASL